MTALLAYPSLRTQSQVLIAQSGHRAANGGILGASARLLRVRLSAIFANPNARGGLCPVHSCSAECGTSDALGLIAQSGTSRANGGGDDQVYRRCSHRMGLLAVGRLGKSRVRPQVRPLGRVVRRRSTGKPRTYGHSKGDLLSYLQWPKEKAT